MSTVTHWPTCRDEAETNSAAYQAADLPDRLSQLPCRASNPDLWFADSPTDLEHAKSLCAQCPVQRVCLAAALDRGEPWGVWGGEILEHGLVISRKRPRGRPRKDAGREVA